MTPAAEFAGHMFRSPLLAQDQHKAAIANHHRKDRAVAKQGRGMF